MSKYAILILSALLIGGFIYFKSELNDRDLKLRDIDIENKEKLIKQRDSLLFLQQHITENYKSKFDSIANAPTKIKYIRYEKPVYTNRTIDSAVSIITNYTY